MKTLINKKLLFFVTFIALMITPNTIKAKAEVVEAVEIKVSASDESDTSLLVDDYVSTRNTYNAGDVITVNTEIPVKSLYIKWNSKPGKWTLTYNDSTATYGNYDFLHEYCELATLTTSLTITINSDGVELCGIQAFPEGEVPEYVQKWEPPCDKADILLFTAHADDEQLYMGAIAPIYAAEKGMKVQYVYFTDHSILYLSDSIREHEKLNGLWAVGVKYYPITGDFYDLNLSEVPKTATKEEVFQFASPFSMEKVHSFLVEQIRRFEPLVIISHDIYGEYGHGTHRVIAYSLMEDVIAANDASKYVKSVNTYGTWDTPKLYLHLYSENVVNLEVNTPLTAFSGKTAFEMAKIGYKYHETQQRFWFHVSDTNEYSITRYGLVRSTVGEDVIKNDIFENLYENPNYSVKIEEARLAAIEAARLEEESRKQAESESISLSIASEEAESLEQLQEEKEKKTFKNIIIIVMIVAIVAIAVIVVLIVLKSNRRKRRGYRHYHK